MELSDHLKQFQTEAEDYLTKGLVSEIEFSGGTYQVLVKDPKTLRDIWTFLQLDGDGAITDFFCEDEEEEGETTPCVHLCAAYLRIFNGHDVPLHKRFEDSLWNALGRLFVDRLGEKPSKLKHEGRGLYSSRSMGDKLLFEIQSKSPETTEWLRQNIEHRKSDTEETSLKFSNLSQEEIKLWREGKPSPQLIYELSYWNDLAKLLMLKQDSGEAYHIIYEYSKKGLPNRIIADFKSVSIQFYISEANLPLIIPTLSTVKSLLHVYDAPEDEIKRITYNKKEGSLHVELAFPLESSPIHIMRAKRGKEGIPIDRWSFVPLDGFYAQEPHWLLSMKTISGETIPEVFRNHFSLIKKLLVDTELHEEPVQVSYTISFDMHWNLHITCYLFSPGDLSFPNSRFFGEYAYIDDDGFYKLEGVLFPEVVTIIPSDQLPDFVVRNKTWLNTQEGFHVHPASIEAQLLYEVNAEGRLSFIGKLESQESSDESKDFGPWVYINGQGFYSKESSYTSMQLRAGASFNKSQISLFIKVNRDELALVPRFFSQRSPVKEALLDIQLDSKDNISLSPHYVLKEEYTNKNVQFFDDFTYVPNEGFLEFPPEARLPERYNHPVDISPDNLEFFLIQELEILQPNIHNIDLRLVKPDRLELISFDIDREVKYGDPLEYIVKLKYQSNIGTVPVADIWKAIKKKKKYLFSNAGLLDLSNRRFDWLRWLHKGQIDQKGNILKLSTIELMRLNALDEISIKESKKEENTTRSKELLEALTKLEPPEAPNLTGLASELRPYQKLGVSWLWFLHHYGLSGLLCDDMGLGKTHQTMALIAALFNARKKEENNLPLHVLVVCPTSVLYHWQEKLAAFLPSLRVRVFYGSDRSLEGFSEDYDLLLTSYGICRIENEVLRTIPFELAVYDEVQLAKNHNTRLYSILLAINARMRIGLTGTPIENHLRELKALFDIVLPLYMPSESDFREFFVKPIERENDPARKKLLSRMIKPFVMRRRKEDVLLDLPDKVEEVSHCDLTVQQARLYNEVLRVGKARILEELQDEQNQVPYIHIFSLLSGLKQICNHPAVYLKCPQDYKSYTSGKWELFLELLNEARESQQKVVVYSQYLFMLDIIEAYLSEMGIGFAGIRGATANRGEQLRRFAHDPTCEVFVASLQAAGLGIDLTSASVVIHYDRWWNAARENQATDRVHRIGQTRGVQVFKLVTKDSFEERIDQLISRKGKLMEDVVGIDDHEVIKSFTREELIEFLQDTSTLG